MEKAKSLGNYFFIKRLLDLIFALVILLPLIPILFVVGIIIVLDSKGGVLFMQDRVGKEGQIFKCLKFRTMKIGTPNISTAEMLKAGISPITRIGFWLRKTSLDELPQIINILLGQMSFIGPRPALPSQEFVVLMRKNAGVDNLLPGITGLAQVRGRDDLSDAEKVKFDMEYVKNLSLHQDLSILFATILIIFSGRGNY